MPNATAAISIQGDWASSSAKPSVPPISIRTMPNTRWWRCNPPSVVTLPGHHGTFGLRMRRALVRMKRKEMRKAAKSSRTLVRTAAAPLEPKSTLMVIALIFPWPEGSMGPAFAAPAERARRSLTAQTRRHHMKIGRALLRAIIGALFVGHGTQKLFGWLGGGGPAGTAQFFEKLELRPPKAHAVAAGAAEALGGAMIAAGLLTPVASTMLSSVMITAIRKVHAQNGVWNTDRGYEYNAVLLATLFALTEHGPGPYS